MSVHPLGSTSRLRAFSSSPGHRRALRQRGLDILELHAAGLQQHQQMKQQIGALGDQVIAIILDRGDHGFDRLFAEFLGTMLRALVQQLAGVGRLSARCGAGIDGGGQIMDRETRHQLNSSTCARPSAAAPSSEMT